MKQDKKHSVSMDALITCTRVAKEEHQRIGQLVVNTLLPTHGHSNPEDILALFYCEDKEFWQNATKALNIL